MSSRPDPTPSPVADRPAAGPSRAGPPLTVRRVGFTYPDDLRAVWVRRFPEFAHAANGISLLMPFAEPYFVASVKAALPQLDPALQARTADFLRQERSHHAQHRRFNDLVLAQYPRTRRVEDWVRRTYGWLDRTRSLRFNLAFAAGSETIAFAIARWSEKRLATLFDGADPVPSTLFLWHLAEEVEHKSAAYDVFEAVDGSRLRYAWATTVSVAILAWFVWLTTMSMLAQDHRLLSPIAHFRLARWGVSLAFEILPTLLVSSLPGHHPDRFADPVFLPQWLRQFDPVSGTLPLWNDPTARTT